MVQGVMGRDHNIGNIPPAKKKRQAFIDALHSNLLLISWNRVSNVNMQIACKFVIDFQEETVLQSVPPDTGGSIRTSARVSPRGSFKHGCTLAAVTITDAIRFLSQLSLAKDLCCPPSSCRTLLAASVC